MSSPLQVNGGFQFTGNPSGTSALLRFKEKSFQVIVDTAYNQSISLQFGERNLAFTGNYTPSTYDPTRMFLMF